MAPRRPTWEDVRTFLARLPETEFDPGNVMFPQGVMRVRGKVIAYPAGGDRGSPPDARPDDEFVFIKTDPAERAALMQQDPKTFFLTPHYEGSPGVIVRLSTVSEDHFRELLADAWRIVAPKRLVKEYDQGLGDDQRS